MTSTLDTGDRRVTIRIATWSLAAMWMIGIALVFRSVPSDLRPSVGPLTFALALTAVSVVLTGMAVHRSPNVPKLGAWAIACAGSFAFTWRDLQWLQGEGRNDGQAGLAWVSPAVYLPLAFFAAIAIVRGATTLSGWFRRR